MVGTTPHELEWEEPNLPANHNDNNFRCFSPGMGAVCNGERTRGSWSHQEQSLHINCLELLAATLEIQSFAKERSGISVVLKIDNTTAVAYINRRGGTISPRLSQLAKNLWLWCMERNILFQAQHVPGMMNSIADTESIKSSGPYQSICSQLACQPSCQYSSAGSPIR